MGPWLVGCAGTPVPTIPDEPQVVQADALSLPPDQAPLGEVIAARALIEWARWGRLDVERSAAGGTCVSTAPGRCETVDDGCGREQSARWCGLVNDYWAQAFIGSGRWFFHDCTGVDICALRWPAGLPPIRTPAWSAAFVSSVMHGAGLDDEQFPRTPYHVDYVRAAIDRPGAAYRVEPVPAAVEPGALVCALRGTDPLDAAQRGQPNPAGGSYQVPVPARIGALRSSRERGGPTPMHCDVVVEVDRGAGRALAIGGNVMQSVSRLAYPLDRDGRISAAAGAIASPLLVMRLRAGVQAHRPSTSPSLATARSASVASPP